jgi:hypothetical protein
MARAVAVAVSPSLTYNSTARGSPTASLDGHMRGILRIIIILFLVRSIPISLRRSNMVCCIGTPWSLG